MLLQSIHLNHFRNCEKSTFSINPLLTIIIGENARGKTNLLESIYTLINGEGFRERKEEELIQIGFQEATITGKFIQNGIFKIILQKKLDVTEKHYFMNKTKKKQAQYLQQQIKAILFSPEQIDLIIGSPGIRRDYFNKLISYYDYEYKKKVDNYDNAIKRRNKVLEMNLNDRELVDELQFWNDYMQDQALYISKIRQNYCDYMNTNPKLNGKEFSILYEKNEFSIERLEKIFQDEKRIKKTLIGPQKDDFLILMKTIDFEKNIHHYGSRSEQRMAIFWLKMNEIHYYECVRKKQPILLLDDIFSELDIHNKKIVLDLVRQYQTVITTTEEEIVNLSKVSHTIIRL